MIESSKKSDDQRKIRATSERSYRQTRDTSTFIIATLCANHEATCVSSGEGLVMSLGAGSTHGRDSAV